MLARRDYRKSSTVTLIMPLNEFREHVEWLELLAPRDGCTRDWRVTLDRLDPPEPDRL